MIIIKSSDLKEFKSFDKLNTRSEWELIKLKQKAKYLYYKYMDASGVAVPDFELISCLNTTEELHGWYTPDNKYIKCIVFISNKAIIITKD